MLNLILVLVLIGVGLYLLDHVPMDNTIRTIIRVLVVIVAILWVLEAIGFMSGVPRLRP